MGNLPAYSTTAFWRHHPGCPQRAAAACPSGLQQGVARRDFGWCGPGVSGWGRGVPQRCWGDGLGKGDLGRLEGSACTRNCTRAKG